MRILSYAANHDCHLTCLVQLSTPPRIDLDGEGLFCLIVACLAGSGEQELCWCVSNVPDYEFGLGLQASTGVGCTGTRPSLCNTAVSAAVPWLCRLA